MAMVLSAWNATDDPYYNNIQHDQIELSFVDDIAEALDAYGQSIDLSVDYSIYTDLAWGGLDFQNNEDLTAFNKERIQYRLTAEQLNTIVFDIAPAGP